MQEKTSSRKKDHIQLALDAQSNPMHADPRFYYEPMLSAHKTAYPETEFIEHHMGLPIWISSMTGGTSDAGNINRNLAVACREYKLGMGLGSCRIILDDDTYFADFDLRDILGDDRPFYANLGIAQVEKLVHTSKAEKISELVKRLRADGLIVHVNPLQELLQPEGDKFEHAPIDTISRLIDKLEIPLIVKEVGQGIGPQSLRALMKLPLRAIEFAAYGGTNFASIELMRAEETHRRTWTSMENVGHSCDTMVDFVNEILKEGNEPAPSFIISGGVKNFLDGYYYINKIKAPAIYGQASEMLRNARVSADAVCEYIESQKQGLIAAASFLTLK